MTTHPVQAAFPTRAFVLTCLIVGIWVNLSEVARYFLVVTPMIRADLAGVADVAPMTPLIFAVWGLWDTLLILVAVFLYWLMSLRFGSGIRVVLGSATLTWSIFVLFWVGVSNMNIASPATAMAALPLAWIEMAVACAIARFGFSRFQKA